MPPNPVRGAGGIVPHSAGPAGAAGLLEPEGADPVVEGDGAEPVGVEPVGGVDGEEVTPPVEPEGVGVALGARLITVGVEPSPPGIDEGAALAPGVVELALAGVATDLLRAPSFPEDPQPRSKAGRSSVGRRVEIRGEFDIGGRFPPGAGSGNTYSERSFVRRGGHVRRGGEGCQAGSWRVSSRRLKGDTMRTLAICIALLAATLVTTGCRRQRREARNELAQESRPAEQRDDRRDQHVEDTTLWEKLGERTVTGAGDHDVIRVGGHEGRFRRVMIKVEHSSLTMYDIVITFGNGETFSPDTRLVFGRNSRSRVIDLPGVERIIRRVDFAYGNLPGGGRAQVELWAKD
jgi:hypothetical protein